MPVLIPLKGREHNSHGAVADKPQSPFLGGFLFDSSQENQERTLFAPLQALNRGFDSTGKQKNPRK